jgi:hypothetical protein
MAYSIGAKLKVADESHVSLTSDRMYMGKDESSEFTLLC